MCAFSLVVDRDLLKDTHTDDVKSPPYHVSGLVFFFMSQNISINRLNFNCIKQIDNIFLCVYCNRSQKTSQRVKNNSHATRLRLVIYYIQYTPMGKCYLCFYILRVLCSICSCRAYNNNIHSSFTTI